MDKREYRTGRKVRGESVLLDDILREEVKREFKKYNVIHVLCDKKGWSRSDYDRIMKWVDRYNRRVEIGLLIDALHELGVNWLDVFERAFYRRKYQFLK